MKETVILIPPSEGKAKDGDGAPLGRVSAMTSKVLEKVYAYADKSKLYGVSGDNLQSAIDSNAKIRSSGTRPALERYVGVLYKGLSYSSLDEDAKRFIDNHVKIVSGMFGLVSARDMIPDYKVKIEKLGLQKFWFPVLTEELKGKFVIDLLPKAHRKALSYDDGVAIDFMIKKNGKVIPAGHDGKMVKGRFLRWLAENHVINPKTMSSFSDLGFSYSHSDSNSIRFIREL